MNEWENLLLRCITDNILNEIGLGDSISSQRTNGFGAAIHKIQNELVA